MQPNRKTRSGSKVQEESIIKGNIIAWLNAQPEIGFVWGNQNVGVWDRKRGQYRRAGIRGVPDIIGYTKKGKMIGIEVKTPGQMKLVDRVMAIGGKTVNFRRKDVKHIIEQNDFMCQMRLCNCPTGFISSLEAIQKGFEILKTEGRI